MHDQTLETDDFTAELDRAVEAHMEWTRRLLRCAMLHTPPGDDVLSPLAHTLCDFWNWFTSKQGLLAALDAEATQRTEAVHTAMHDSIRRLCGRLLSGQDWDSTELERFEHTQAELLSLLARFKNLSLSRRILTTR
ncbi:MAG: hypothetical protein R6W97_01040 [Thiobacillus sp.]